MDEEINVAGASKNILGTADKSIREKDKGVAEKLLLSGKKIGISISDNADLLKLGYSSMHLQDAGIEFARYLLVHGAKLIYGGDLRKNGFTSLFSDLSKLYTTKETSDQFHFKNYFAWPIHLKLLKSNELDYRQNKVEIVKLPLPPGIVNIDPSVAIFPDTNENKTIWAKSVGYMRKVMNDDCDARIFLGGTVQKYWGKYPGIAEEACLALTKNIPVYFIGAYGGATKELINLILNQQANLLTEDFQFSDNAYQQFYEFWNKNEEDKIDYKKLSRFFTEYGLEKVCLNNGLTEDENKRLFVTNNLAEMIYFVLKGLSAINAKV